MEIFLSSEELDVAIKEYVTKRGINPDLYLGTYFKAGRKGNGTVAYVNIGLNVRPELDQPAPKVYENLNKQVSATVEAIHEVEAEELLAEQQDLQNTIEDIIEDYSEYESAVAENDSGSDEGIRSLFDNEELDNVKPISSTKKLFG